VMMRWICWALLRPKILLGCLLCPGLYGVFEVLFAPN